MPETDTIPVSASVASTGLGIRYISNWAYAYSGRFTVSTSDQTQLLFTTGSGVISGIIQAHGPVSEVTSQNGRISTWRIYFNDLIVAYIKADTTATANTVSTSPTVVNVIVPHEQK